MAEIVMGIIQEVVRDLAGIIIITIIEEAIIEIKMMIEIGVGHMRGR